MAVVRARLATRLADGRRTSPGRLVLHASVVLLLAVWLLPTAGMLVNSVRHVQDINHAPWWTALRPGAELTMDNYAHVLGEGGLTRSFVNSLIITIPATFIPMALAAFAGYTFAWMRFRGRELAFVIVVGLLVVPLQVTLVPVLTFFRDAGIAGSYLSVWLAHTAYGLPFAIYLMRNAMGGLPSEVFESAAIDGAGHGTSFFRLAVPMTVPAIASLVIFQFIFVWNDLLVSLIYLGATNASKLPLTVLVANLQNSRGGEWQYLMSAAFLSMLLPLVVFFAFQRYFVRGITAASVKG